MLIYYDKKSHWSNPLLLCRILAMKQILETFSPEVSTPLVGDEIQKKTLFPKKPEKVFDVHGYYEDEISGKMKFVFAFSADRHFTHIKVITGKGQQILFSEVKRILLRMQKNAEISRFTNDEGSFNIYI